MISRRRWLHVVAVLAAPPLAGRLGSQQAQSKVVDTSNLFPMDQSAARSVRLPPKPGATPAITPDQRDTLEHRIRCQCGCTLDVYTCRTTDFSCQVSPAMHRDILALVDGGYTPQEILDAFVNVYGDRALMAPPKEGFNIVGYVLPGIVIGLGAIALAVLLRRWKREPQQMTATVLPIDATPQELARLEAAVRDDQ